MVYNKPVMDILKRLEWIPKEYFHECPICRESRKYGHSPDCELAKALIDGGEKDVNIQPILFKLT